MELDMSDETDKQTYTKEQWQQFCQEWETCGEPQELFCMRKGIPYNTFVYWRGKFTKKRKQESEEKFSTIKINKHTSSASMALRIDLPNGVSITHIKDKQTLSMVLSLLGIKKC